VELLGKFIRVGQVLSDKILNLNSKTNQFLYDKHYDFNVFLLGTNLEDGSEIAVKLEPIKTKFP